MELTDQEKKDIVECMLRKISHIGDKDYQRRVWIEGEGSECDDFIETVCLFFYAAEIVLERENEFALNDQSFRILENFLQLFEEFSEENDLPQLFIDTPQWTHITQMAKELLHTFTYDQNKNAENELI